MTQVAEIDEAGKVVNLIIVDLANVPEWAANWPVASEGVAIGFTYADGVFTPPVEPPPVEPPPPNLTPSQWAFFLDVTGLRETLDATLAAMPKTTLQERATWAGMRAVSAHSEYYQLSVTLALVAQVRAMAVVENIPADTEISGAWDMAAAFNGAASLGVV